MGVLVVIAFLAAAGTFACVVATLFFIRLIGARPLEVLEYFGLAERTVVKPPRLRPLIADPQPAAEPVTRRVAARRDGHTVPVA